MAEVDILLICMVCTWGIGSGEGWGSWAVCERATSRAWVALAGCARVLLTKAQALG